LVLQALGAWSKDVNNQLKETQMAKLPNVIRHALCTPFYLNRIANCPDEIAGVDPLEIIRALPFTYKQDLRDTAAMERTCLSKSDLLAFFSSSGSTGEPSVYAFSKHDLAVSLDISKRILSSLGVGPGDMALLPVPFGMPLAWFIMVNEMIQMGASFIPLGTAPLDAAARALIDYPVTIMRTSPIMASRLYSYVRENDPSLLKKMRLRQIHLAGYAASSARKRRLEAQWGAKCFSIYGMSEIGLLAGECSEANGQHLSADYVLTEVINPDSGLPVPLGETGVGVYTPLWNKGSPLLRYWSDDHIMIKEGTCGCGSDLPRLYIKGRGIDSFVMNRRRIFSSDIEDVLLADDQAGDEFLVEIVKEKGEDRCKIKIEASGNLCTSPIVRDLEALVGARVEMHVLPRRMFDLSNPKPVRIVDRRIHPQ
jgi:phenylacetate-CoA ligase